MSPDGYGEINGAHEAIVEWVAMKIEATLMSVRFGFCALYLSHVGWKA